MNYSLKNFRYFDPVIALENIIVIFFRWTLETFKLGYSRDITDGDLYAPLPEHRSDILGKIISLNSNQHYYFLALYWYNIFSSILIYHSPVHFLSTSFLAISSFWQYLHFFGRPLLSYPYYYLSYI